MVRGSNELMCQTSKGHTVLWKVLWRKSYTYGYNSNGDSDKENIAGDGGCVNDVN